MALVEITLGLAPPRPARNRVVGSTCDGADQFLIRRIGVEDAVVAPEPEHDDPVGDGADILHVVADHDHAEAAVADTVVVLRLGRNNGVFDVEQVSSEDIIAAITGATDNVVSQRSARRTRPAADLQEGSSR